MLYEKRIPPFAFFIIVVIMLIFVITIIWMCCSKKIFIIKGNGIVESENKNYIMTPYSGKIKELCVKEGAAISRGEVAFVIQSIENEQQKEQSNIQKKQLINGDSLPVSKKYRSEVKRSIIKEDWI